MDVEYKKRIEKILDGRNNIGTLEQGMLVIQRAQLALMVDILEQLEYLNVTLTQEIHNARNR